LMTFRAASSVMARSIAKFPQVLEAIFKTCGKTHLESGAGFD
jgi:hypothetical protein